MPQSSANSSVTAWFNRANFKLCLVPIFVESLYANAGGMVSCFFNKNNQ
jgi:hypothetical protein